MITLGIRRERAPQAMSAPSLGPPLRTPRGYVVGVEDWNREHGWAKSHGDFGASTGPGTDIHHLRPTDVTVNSDQGNLDFDEADASAVENPEAPGNFRDGDSWEPRNDVIFTDYQFNRNPFIDHPEWANSIWN